MVALYDAHEQAVLHNYNSWNEIHSQHLFARKVEDLERQLHPELGSRVREPRTYEMDVEKPGIAMTYYTETDQPTMGNSLLQDAY